MLSDKRHHLFLRPGINAALQLDSLFLTKILDQLICAETLMAFLTIHQRIRKSTQMTGSHPCLRVHQDSAVHTYVVGISLYEFLPPCLFNIVFEFDTKITVIPGVGQSAIDLGARIYKTSGFCQGNDFVHCLFHNIVLLYLYTDISA